MSKVDKVEYGPDYKTPTMGGLGEAYVGKCKDVRRLKAIIAELVEASAKVLIQILPIYMNTTVSPDQCDALSAAITKAKEAINE